MDERSGLLGSFSVSIRNQDTAFHQTTSSSVYGCLFDIQIATSLDIGANHNHTRWMPDSNDTILSAGDLRGLGR